MGGKYRFTLAFQKCPEDYSQLAKLEMKLSWTPHFLHHTDPHSRANVTQFLYSSTSVLRSTETETCIHAANILTFSLALPHALTIQYLPIWKLEKEK